MYLAAFPAFYYFGLSSFKYSFCFLVPDEGLSAETLLSLNLIASVVGSVWESVP